jgi:oligoribonuclease NrnB/cAMP/cGMP phosphodiesterase (DHH superfamily)
MKSIIERFSGNLIQVEYPIKKEHWNIAGVLKHRSNQHLKFDVRGMFRLPEGRLAKKGYTATKADKMVFETENEWIILDVSEIHKYLKKQQTKILYLEKLMDELEWSITLPK